MKVKHEDMLLYAVTDRAWLKGETLYAQVEKALKGGATFVQLREKTLDEASFLEEAKELRALCKSYGVPFVINDNVAIAAAVDADGVHVGQDDMGAIRARETLGPGKIVGVSTHSVEEALEAEKNGADYIGVGAVFQTGTKTDANVLSHDVVKAITKAVKIPVVAIGGISAANVTQLAGTGIDGIAVVSAIFAQPDIEKAAAGLKEIVASAVVR